MITEKTLHDKLATQWQRTIDEIDFQSPRGEKSEHRIQC